MLATTGGCSSSPIMGLIRAVHSDSSGSSEVSEDKHPDSKRQRQKTAKKMEEEVLFLRMGKRRWLCLLSLATTLVHLVA